jgi:hypothetical protein
MVRLIDGRELSLIAKRSAAPISNTEVNRLAGPSRSVDVSFLPTAADPAHNEQLKAAIIDLIERILPITLQDMGWDRS